MRGKTMGRRSKLMKMIKQTYNFIPKKGENPFKKGKMNPSRPKPLFPLHKVLV